MRSKFNSYKIVLAFVGGSQYKLTSDKILCVNYQTQDIIAALNFISNVVFAMDL